MHYKNFKKLNLLTSLPLAMWISFPNCICTVSGFGPGAKKLYSICCSHQNCAVKSLTLRYPKPPLNLSRGVRSPGLVFLEVASTSDDSK